MLVSDEFDLFPARIWLLDPEARFSQLFVYSNAEIWIKRGGVWIAEPEWRKDAGGCQSHSLVRPRRSAAQPADEVVLRVRSGE
jgi:hypothetical protein